MLAQMIDKIVSLKETKTFEIGGQTYTDGHLTRIPPHVDRPEAISVSGLDGVCKLIRTELEKVGTTIMVQAKSYKSVEVMTTYLPDFSRNILYRAEADAPGLRTGPAHRLPRPRGRSDRAAQPVHPQRGHGLPARPAEPDDGREKRQNK